MKTKKVGMAGRFGPRYGSRVLNTWRGVMEKVKGVQKCPRCQTKNSNMRDFLGVWECPKCGARWTGGAWEPETDRGRESVRTSNRLGRELQEAEEAQKASQTAQAAVEGEKKAN